MTQNSFISKEIMFCRKIKQLIPRVLCFIQNSHEISNQPTQYLKVNPVQLALSSSTSEVSFPKILNFLLKTTFFLEIRPVSLNFTEIRPPAPI